MATVHGEHSKQLNVQQKRCMLTLGGSYEDAFLEASADSALRNRSFSEARRAEVVPAERCNPFSQDSLSEGLTSNGLSLSALDGRSDEMLALGDRMRDR